MRRREERRAAVGNSERLRRRKEAEAKPLLSMFSKLRKNRKGVLYVYVTILAALVVWACLMFILNNVFSTVRSSCMSITDQLETNSTMYSLVDSFMSNLMTYLLIIALIGLTYWAYVYSQRKGSPFG